MIMLALTSVSGCGLVLDEPTAHADQVRATPTNQAGRPTGSPTTPTNLAGRPTGSPTTPKSQAGRPTGSPAAAPRTASSALAALPVKGRAAKTGYTREQFGQAWSDIDHNGCDQRNDVLARDLTNTKLKQGSRCIVASGTLHDPYTGKTIAFTRGQGTSEAVQIDHLVALSNAWQTGAQQLPADQRLLLGNDPLNLLAVDGPTNQSKGDGDAATWLPQTKAFRCPYVARQIAVKTRYHLWVTSAEKAAMLNVLDTCPNEPLPTAPEPPGLR